MGDAAFKDTTTPVLIVGSSDADGAESTPIRASGTRDLGAVDTVNTAAKSKIIALTAAVNGIELFYTIARLADRKYIWMQALDNNIVWGFSPTECVFPIFKSQLLTFPIGDVPIYARTTTGTGNIAFGEGS